MTTDEAGFTIKEMLVRLGNQLEGMDSKLDSLNTRMELKAERADFDNLRGEVAAIKLVQAQAAPIDTRASVENHLREPHGVAGRHEQRITSLEKWKYSIPPAAILALTSIVVAIWKAG